MVATDPIDEIFRLFAAYGTSKYDEKVSLADHCLQTAELARDQQANREVVAAALLHDLGHFMLAEARGNEEFRTVDWEHDRVAAEWIRPRFGNTVADAVGGHVAAKRWLCHAEPEYYDRLSPSSRDSLAVQGGPFTAEEARRFESEASFDTAVALRRWDDDGKVAGLEIAPLTSYEPLLRSLLR